MCSQGHARRNKYGLGRTIPEDVKRIVRQKCAFGCAKCGNAIYEYHHFDPPWALAKKHKPRGLVLLCPTCHSKTEKGLLSDDTVRLAEQSPFARRRGFSAQELDGGETTPAITVCGQTFKNMTIMIENEVFLTIEPPSANCPVYAISGIFLNESGEPLFSVYRNELKYASRNWDVEEVGKETVFRASSRIIVMRYATTPRVGIAISKLKLEANEVALDGSGDELILRNRKGEVTRMVGNSFSAGSSTGQLNILRSREIHLSSSPRILTDREWDRFRVV